MRFSDATDSENELGIVRVNVPDEAETITCSAVVLVRLTEALPLASVIDVVVLSFALPVTAQVIDAFDAALLSDVIA